MIEKEYLNTNYPIKIKLTRSEKNLGFSGGNNRIMEDVLKNTKSPLVMLLNVDTEIQPDCIVNLVKSMREDSAAGMIEALQEPREHPKYYDKSTLETHWCSGGGVLIRREALQETGLFDDRFFLYCEDVDLSWRMWLHGWRCKINPEAKYSHYTEFQDKGKDLSTQHYFSMRNCLYMHYKYDSKAGISMVERQLDQAIASEQNTLHKEILTKARDDAKKNRSKFSWDRFKLSTYPKSRWMMFNGFYFERRREFRDDEDKRVMLS